MNTTQEPLSVQMSKDNFLRTVGDNNEVIMTFLKDALENNRTLLKSTSLLNIIPSIADFKSKFYRNNISLLCCNLLSLSYDISKFAYPNDNSVRDSLNNSFNRLAVFPGAVVKQILVYTCISNYKNYNSYGGFICEYTLPDNTKSAFIVLRGTAFLCEVYIDVLQILVRPDWTTNATVSVHTGFNSAYSVYKNGSIVKTLRDQIRSYLDTRPNIQNLYITGHSLGASLSALLMADLAVAYPSIRLITKTYAVALPYTGNSSFVNLITTSPPRIIPPPITATYTGFFAIGNNSDPAFIFGLPFYQRIPIQIFCFSEMALNPHSIALYMKNIRNNPQWEVNATRQASCGLVCR